MVSGGNWVFQVDNEHAFFCNEVIVRIDMRSVANFPGVISCVKWFTLIVLNCP